MLGPAFLVLWIFAQSGPAPAGVRDLSGVVREAGTRAPIPGASVVVVGTGASAECRTDGSFSIAAPASGVIMLRAAAAGFETVDREIALPHHGRLDFFLRRAGEGFETVVSGKRKKEDQFEKNLAAEEVRGIPGTLGDPLRSVQNLPGVARAGYLGGAIAVRGSNPTDTGFYVDGRSIPVLYHFADGPTVLNSDLIDHLRFMPGGFPPEYGRTTSGVIEVRSRKGQGDRLHVTAKADVFDLSVFSEGPITADGTSTFMAGIRRSHLDALLSAFSDEAARFSVLPRYYDYQLKADFPIPGTRGASVFAMGSDDEVAVGGLPLRQQLAFSSDFHRLFFDTTLNLPKGAALSLKPSIGYDYARNARDVSAVSAVTLMTGFLAEVEVPATDWLDVAAGLDVSVKRYDFRLVSKRDPDVGLFPTPADIYAVRLEQEGIAWGRDGALYTRGEFRPMPSVSLIPGVRLDGYWFEDVYLGGVDPRFQARWRAVSWMTLKAAWGVYRAMPQPVELSKEAGNPALGLERSDQVGAGAEFSLPWGIEADVQVFNKWLDDIVVRSNDAVETGGGLSRQRYSNEGTGRSYGLEVFVHHRSPGKSFGWVAYTLSKSERGQSGGEDMYPFWLDQTHVLNVIFSRHVAWGVFAGFRFRLTTGNPYTPASGSLFDADANRYSPFWGDRRSERLPTYHQLDLRLEKSFVFDRWLLNMYVDLMNVYNQRNYEYYMYDYDYTHIVPIEGLPFLPSLGVIGRF
ncbi:MAG: TonB-dependent receptor [Deltaproteobacteria bacterium]|nr:TonB-dependent receptor [Deltaproteobacteria bacterium]